MKAENPEEYITAHILNFWGPYPFIINQLCTQETPVPACSENIESLKRIKAKCDQKGIKLTVIIGPTFLTEMSKYNSSAYMDYIHDLVQIVPVWNFGGINSVNLNPDYFCDGGHYWIELADQILTYVYSNTKDALPQDFGILLTPENVDEYLEQQKSKFLDLRKELGF